jgi:hypothetical protein
MSTIPRRKSTPPSCQKLPPPRNERLVGVERLKKAPPPVFLFLEEKEVSAREEDRETAVERW